MSGAPRVLFVDDDLAVQRAFVRSLSGVLLTIECYNGVADAVAALGSAYYDVVVTDMTMHDGTGLDVLKACATHLPNAVRIVVSGDANLHGGLTETGVDDVIAKPWDIRDLRERMQNAVRLATTRSTQSA